MNVEAPVKPSTALAGAEATDEMVKLMQLLEESTSLELKLVVPDRSLRAGVKGLGFDPVEAEPRQAYFFDTPDLALDKAGIVVRARRMPGGAGDTVVKLRPVDPAALDPEVRLSEGFKIELDVMPGGGVCSASFKGVCTSKKVLKAVEGKAPLESIFSREQRAFYEAHAPAGISLNDLVVLGPVFLLRLKYQPAGFDARVTVELWLYPDGTRIFEISTKGPPSQAFHVLAKFRVFLAKAGILIEKSEVTKTGSSLKYFGKKPAAQGTPAALSPS